MIRVLQFGMSQNYGGIEAFIMNYYREMDRTKIQFDFAKPDENMKMAYEDEILRLGGKIYIYPVIGLRNGYYKLKKAWLEFYKNIDVDEIHFNTVALMNLYAIKFAKKAGLRVHVHAHPSVYGKGFSWWVRFRMWVNKRSVHKYADTLLACSDEAGKWMFGTEYQVIPNSIDCDKFEFDWKVRKQVREKYGVAEAFVLLHVGKLSVVKNQMFLLDVFQEVKKRRTDAKLILVGFDALKGAIQKKVKELGLQDDVILTGMVQNPEVFYSAADIFLFPSLSEGLPVALIEAQVNGLPTIVSDQITEGANASGRLRYLAIEDNRDGKRACELWADEICAKNERLTKEEMQAVRSVYDIKTSVKKLEDIYQI